jgi:HrpA-like RNA helicase
MIGITQPRRVAAVSTAARVAVEMNTDPVEKGSGIVGHQIRYVDS